ncbi:MAG: hypothetical protein KGM99_19240, partial [Burkholderiales bacterium]|nr:hypothetical protein [Burkholderiales bacterium]
MFLLVVPFLFLLACAGAWLLLFPSGREIVGRNLLQWNGQLNAKIKLWQLSKFTQSKRFLASLRTAANELRRFFRQHRIVFFMVFPIIFLPPLIVLLLAP